MENELLHQILAELKELKAGQKALEAGQKALEAGQKNLEAAQKTTNERLDKVEQEARHTRVRHNRNGCCPQNSTDRRAAQRNY